MTEMQREQKPLYSTIDIIPPVKGIFQPFEDIYNPLLVDGQMVSCKNWRSRNGITLQLLEGYETVTNSIAGACRAIVSYKSAASGKNDLIYFDDTNLEYTDLAGNTTGTIAAGISPGTGTRVPFVKFLNRILFATRSDGLIWYDPEARTARKCGVVAPTVALTAVAGAAGVPNATYKYWYTFVNDQGHESQLSPVATVTLANQQGSLSVIAVGATGTSSRKVYRSTAGGALPLFLTTIADNVTTTYLDNAADAALGALHEGDYTVPPNNIQNVCIFNNRVYLIEYNSAGNTKVWICKVDASTGLPNFEAFPSSLSLSYPSASGGDDSILSLIPIGQTLFVWGRLTGFRTLGEPGSTTYTEELPWKTGIKGAFAFCYTDVGVIFLDNTNRLRLFDGKSAPKEIGQGGWGFLKRVEFNAAHLTYDAQNQCVYIIFRNSTDAVDKFYIYDIEMDSFTEAVGWGWRVIHVSPFDNMTYVSTTGGLFKLQFGESLGFLQNAALPSTTTMEFHPISPEPGEVVYMGRLEAIVKAQPIVSGVIPMLKFEWSFDDGAFFETKYVDISRDYLVYSKGAAFVKRTIEVPLYRHATSISIKVSTALNTASIANGCEIYSLKLHYKGRTEAKDGGKNFRDGGRIYNNNQF
jgi:hypothetical protein